MEAVTSALLTVVVALVGYVANKVTNWLKEKGITEKLTKKRYLVEIAVDAVEQIYKNEDGPVKKDKAKQMALELLNDSGLVITSSELDSFLEASVHEINKAIKGEEINFKTASGITISDGLVELESDKIVLDGKTVVGQINESDDDTTI